MITDRSENRGFEIFLLHFEVNLTKFDHNHRDAYEKTDQDFEARNGFRKFSTYESFKNAKARHFKKQKSIRRTR